MLVAVATVTTARVRAPELRGRGGWINSDRPLTLAALRGRVVLLDFWTFCCINCLRVIEELRPLEERFGDALVVIGVHSPKFPHEADHAAVERAVLRHRVRHPVLDDPDMDTWEQYGVRAWPTLVVVDPDGYVAGTASGEGNGEALERLIASLLDGRPAVVKPAFRSAAPSAGGALAFPGKACSDGAGRFAVADTGHGRVLIADLDGSVLATFDGFDQPQGVRFDGERVLVCDSTRGTVVAVPLDGGPRSTLAEGLHSPWDVVVLPSGEAAIAEAGLHRVLAVPRDAGTPRVLAGTRAEGLRDGPAELAHLAQPSGLCLLADGALAIADSEVSALRVLRDGEVETLAGQGLFDWGCADGDRRTARLQHPLGVATLPDGSIAVADTFNSLIRVWRAGMLTTLAVDGRLDEPGGIDVLPDGRLLVADTGGHRVVALDARTGTLEQILPATGAAPVRAGGRPAQTTLWSEAPERDATRPAIQGISGAEVELDAAFDLDAQPLDRSQGPPVHLTLSADPPALLGPGPRVWAFDAPPVAVRARLGAPGTGTIRLDLAIAVCEDDLCTLRRFTRSFDVDVM
jgi:thiol-disulfide isomerase/thioredoxin